MSDVLGMPYKKNSFNGAAGGRLRAVQEAIGLRQGEFAKLLGIETNTLANSQAGRSAPRPHWLVPLKDRYGVTMDYIFTGDMSGVPKKIADKLTELHEVPAVATKSKRVA